MWHIWYNVHIILDSGVNFNGSLRSWTEDSSISTQPSNISTEWDSFEPLRLKRNGFEDTPPKIYWKPGLNPLYVENSIKVNFIYHLAIARVFNFAWVWFKCCRGKPDFVWKCHIYKVLNLKPVGGSWVGVSTEGTPWLQT